MPPSNNDPAAFDLVVIGGGPAGITGATTAAGLGKRVALIDNHHELGGAGANTGTVPSKTLRETALAFSGMRSRNLYGVDLSLRREATVADFLHHERDVKNGLNHVLADRLRESNTEVYCATARFEDAHHVRVGIKHGQEFSIRGDKILIATGSSPVRPPTFPFGTPEIYDSDTILDLDRLPKSMAVVGAGVIGCEYACMFAVLGTRIHVVDGRDTLLPFLDAEISAALRQAMEQHGISFLWKHEVVRCEGTAEGEVALHFASGKNLNVDAVLVAAGRSSNTGDLNLAAAGVQSGARGLIAVDEHYQTNVPNILAAGDVIGFPALASTSMDQARRAVRHAFGYSFDHRASTLLPTGIYTIPETSMAGETEESLRKKGVPYVAGRGRYANSARGRIIGDSEGLLKLLFRRDDGKLVGVHVIGEQATELVHVGLLALLAGADVNIFDEACFNIPTLGALYKTAALEALSALQPGPENR